MNKFVVLISTPTRIMDEWMTGTDESARKSDMDQMMADWKTWADAHKDAILDEGMPLGKTKRVTKDGVTDSRNDLNYMMTVQAESHEEAAQLFVDNPHLTLIPESYAEVMSSSDMNAMS